MEVTVWGQAAGHGEGFKSREQLVWKEVPLSGGPRSALPQRLLLSSEPQFPDLYARGDAMRPILTSSGRIRGDVDTGVALPDHHPS